MLFPEYKRVIYQKNPLAQVICQLRFPALEAMERPPREYWHRIRDRYPYMEVKDSAAMEVPISLPREVLAALPRLKSYDFISQDELWKVTLADDFVALTCSSYERWEEFRDYLQVALDALKEVLPVSTFTRVGLRYINVIQRSLLGIEASLWTELLQPVLAGELTSPDISEQIEHVAREVVLNLEDQMESRMQIRHGFVRVEGSEETCYMIDSDIFTEKGVGFSHAIDTLEQYKATGGRFFRWCITDSLHRAMGPLDV